MPAPLNRLLLALSPADLGRLMPDLEQVPLQLGDILLDVDKPIDYIFFPDSGIISVVTIYTSGDVVEMATIGREGCTGFRPIFGAQFSTARFLVQVPGRTTRMHRAAFLRAIDSIPAFRNLIFAYVPAFLEQVLAIATMEGPTSSITEIATTSCQATPLGSLCLIMIFATAFAPRPVYLR